MGTINRFNLQKFIYQTGAEYFFETGTWKGDGLAYACKFPFKKLYSSEIIDSVAERARQRFKGDDRVTIINDSSTNSLISYLPKIKGPCIFWLDAHFPGAEEGLKGYNEITDENLKLPLQKELEVISSRKNIYEDVIMIDDLRIYEEGPFTSGNLPDHVLSPKIRNTNFVLQIFGDTHTSIKSYKDEGYIILIPRKIKQVPFLKNTWFHLVSKLSKKIIC